MISRRQASEPREGVLLTVVAAVPAGTRRAMQDYRSNPTCTQQQAEQHCIAPVGSLSIARSSLRNELSSFAFILRQISAHRPSWFKLLLNVNPVISETAFAFSANNLSTINKDKVHLGGKGGQRWQLLTDTNGVGVRKSCESTWTWKKSGWRHSMLK